MARITVLGIGNVLLGDEGFGVRAVEQLIREYSLPEEVQVLDGGTIGMGLMRFLTDTQRLIVVDAILGSEKPGTVYEFRGDEVKLYFKNKVSLHELGIQEVLAALEVLGRPIDEVVVIGVQPSSIQIGLELSPVIQDSVNLVLDRIIKQLGIWQVEMKKI